MEKEKIKPVYRYNWEFIVYDDPKPFVESLNEQWKWAYAYHDGDEKEDGTPKEPHWHILVHADFKISQTDTVNRRMKMLKGNKFWKEIGDKVKAFEYLWHKNNPEKFQYGKDVVQTKWWYWWSGKRKEEQSDKAERNVALEMFEAYEQGYGIYDMLKKFGMNYLRNYKAIEELHWRYVQDIIHAHEVEGDLDLHMAFD